MWDETPYLDALAQTAHPSLRESQDLRQHLERVILREGERRPEFAHLMAPLLMETPKGFVYDRPSGLIFAGGWADHERCAADLMRMRELRGPVNWERADRGVELDDGAAADRYLEAEMGFIANSPQLTASSGVWPLSVGANVRLSAEEKLWFRHMDIRRR